MRSRVSIKSNSSGVSGVHFCKTNSQWVSRIPIRGKRKCLGYFDNLLDAVKARYEAEIKYNWLECQTDSSAYRYLKDKNLL